MNNIIRKVAEQNGVHESEVEREIEIALKTAMESCDDTAQKFWDGMASDGKELSLEAVLAKIAAVIKIGAEAVSSDVGC